MSVGKRIIYDSRIIAYNAHESIFDRKPMRNVCTCIVLFSMLSPSTRVQHARAIHTIEIKTNLISTATETKAVHGCVRLKDQPPKRKQIYKNDNEEKKNLSYMSYNRHFCYRTCFRPCSAHEPKYSSRDWEKGSKRRRRISPSRTGDVRWSSVVLVANRCSSAAFAVNTHRLPTVVE